jgi:ATP-binding cassette subfamily B protein
MVSTFFVLAQPWMTKLLIDRGLLARRMDLVVTLCGVMLGIAVVAAALQGINGLLYTDLSARVLFAMREAVYRHLTTLPPTFYARMNSGDLMARLDGDVSEIQRFCVDGVLAGVNGVAALAITIGLLISLSGRLSILALVLLPAEALFLRAMRPRVEHHTRRLRERASQLAGFFFETLPAMKFVQSVGAEEFEAGRLHALNRSYLRDLLKLQTVNFFTGAVPGLLTSVSGAVVFVAGGYMMIRGQLTLGSLVAFQAYLGRATGPVQTLLGIYLAVQRAQVSVVRVRELTRTEPAVTSAARPLHLPRDAKGEIRIEGVGFAYEEGAPAVLADADMFIPAGRKIGVIGPSGAGKSTFVDLLQRHFDPAAGRILLDGIELRALSLGELRRRVTVVAQDTVLFSGTIIENLRYAAPDADDAAVRRAAERARVHEFVRLFPRAYDTEVGARGIALSGGQRQRIAIARALLQDPLVLVLDEATSAIDLETEAWINDEIDRLFPNRTRIVVTHRPQTLANAEIIYRIVDGRIVLERAIRGVAA